MIFGLNRHKTTIVFRESTALIHLALPMFVAQIAQVGTGFLDTVMAGRVGTDDLAAVALGSSIFIIVYVTLMGAAVALNPILSHQFGAGETKLIGKTGRQGLWYCFFLGIIGVLVLIAAQPLLRIALDLPADVVDKTMLYLTGITIAMPAAMLQRALHAYASSLNRPRVIMIVSTLALAINIPLNFIFIYGLYGVPKLGGAGCGWASACAFWFNALTLLTYISCHSYFKRFALIERFEWPNWKEIFQFLKLGAPMALSYFLEISLFCVIVLLLSRFGTVFVASQQTVINVTSLAYMVPQSLATALSIRVGQFAGSRDYISARISCKVGLLVGLIFALIACIFLITFRHAIIGLYTSDPQVIQIATALLIWAGFNQFGDSTQTITSGALRGYKLAFKPMLIHAFSFWGIGLLLGCYLGLWAHGSWFGYTFPLGIYGFWVGLAISLLVAASLLSYYLNLVSREHLIYQK